MEQTKDIFGKRLFEIRENRGESQQELADSIGITRQSLSRYELGERTANIDLLKKISEHYNVSADYLLGIAKEKTIKPDLQAACKYTGLNEEAIENLKESCNIHSNIGNSETFKILNWLLSESYVEDIAIELKFVKEKSESYLRLKKDFNEKYPNGFPNETIIPELPITDKEYITYLNIESIMHNTKLECDVSRYNIIKIVEKLSNHFDQREQVQDNGKHNPPKE